MEILSETRKKKLRLPLFWKFTTGIILVVFLFGSINIFLIDAVIYDSLQDELEQRGVYISKVLSERATELLLVDDIAGLNKLVDDMKSIDTSVEYVFILRHNLEVAAHTFPDRVPSVLIDYSYHIENEDARYSYITPVNSSIIIRDITVPLFEGRVGYARIGLTDSHITDAVNRAVKVLLWMVILFLIFGIIMTLGFSYILTYPVKSISDIAETTNLNDLLKRKTGFARRYPGAISDIMKFQPDDELDFLVDKFNEMVLRLQSAYKEIESAQTKIIESEKMASIGSLASGVAHEVNNPLAGIMHCIERMQKQPGNVDEVVKYLDLMSDAAVKIESVIEGLLSFARQPEQIREKVFVDELIENAILLASHRFEKSTIIVDHIRPIDRLMVNVNRNRIEQVFLNLLLNSVDAITEKCSQNSNFRGKITIQTKFEEGFIEVVFRDNGVGIAAANIDKVTDPFFTTKAPGKGTGLGLAVSIGIVREHGGNFRISSIEGEQTVIYISLP